MMRMNQRAPQLRLLTIAALCALILPFAACSAPERPSESSTQSMNTAPDIAEKDASRRNLNPAPKRAFEIRLTIDGAPGPLPEVSATAQYDVTNDAECGRYNRLAGVAERITSNEELTLNKVSDSEYTAVVYLDRILDEDYYGNGICRWKLSEARIALRADGSEATRFVPKLPAEVLTAGGSETRYFWKGYYPRTKSGNFPDFGDKTLDEVPVEKRGEFFTMILSAKEVQP